jgi:prepilin-type N-terminal cleavage/methylation domain-containing protein
MTIRSSQTTIQKGFTLVEMMMVVCIMSILMLGVVGMFLALLTGQGKTNALSRVRQEGDLSTVAIEQELRDGFEIGNTCPSNTINPGTASIEIYKRDANNFTKCSQLTIAGGKVVVYDYNSSQCTGTSVTRNLTSSEMTASNIQIWCKQGNQFDHDLVRVDYTLQDVANPTTSIPFRVITALRNIQGIN